MATERNQVQLDMAFEGIAVEGGSMNVRDLAPSMLMSELYLVWVSFAYG